MGVSRRDNSRYWYIQFQFQGRTYIRSSRTTDKRAAEQMEREWKRTLHAQRFLGQRERITIRDAVALFMSSKQGTPNHRNLAAHARTLERTFRSGRYLDEITTEDTERLLRDREREGASPATIRHLFNLLGGTRKNAKRLGYQASDFDLPAVKVDKSRLRYLSAAEEGCLLAELDPHRPIQGVPPYERRRPSLIRQMWDVHDLVVLLLDTGARYSEIANLEWRQINLDDGTIHLWRPKVQNESVLYMTDRAAQVLRRRFADRRSSRHVFQNKKGGKRGYAGIAIRKAIRRAQLEDCCIHTLRHTHASRLIQNGMSLYEVKEVLGHSDIKTTMRYAHLERREVLSRARDVIDRLNREAGSTDKAAPSERDVLSDRTSL
jgi:integrase